MGRHRENDVPETPAQTRARLEEQLTWWNGPKPYDAWEGELAKIRSIEAQLAALDGLDAPPPVNQPGESSPA